MKTKKEVKLFKPAGALLIVIGSFMLMLSIVAMIKLIEEKPWKRKIINVKQTEGRIITDAARHKLSYFSWSNN